MRRVKKATEAALAFAWWARLDDYPTALAVSRDGARAALGFGSGGLAVLDVPTGEVVERIAAHQGATLAVTWNPRSGIVTTTGEDGVARAHQRGEAITYGEPGGGWVEHAAWSPKGARLATAQGRRVAIWNEDGRAIGRTLPLDSTVTGIAWSPDGRRVAASVYGGVRLIDPLDGLVRTRLDWKGSMISVAWSPDGRFIACGCQDGTVHFWRVASGQDAMMSGYPLKPTALAWSHDTKQLATSGSPVITIWPFDGKGPEGREPIELTGHGEPVTALAYAPLVRLLASGCRGGDVAVWAPGELDAPIAQHELGGKVVAVAWAADVEREHLTLLAASDRGEVVALRM